MDEVAQAPRASTPAWLRFVVGRNPVWTVLRVLAVVAICLVVFKFVLLPIQVTGFSMYPTYKSGQIKFVNRLAYKRSLPQRGDVVAVQFAGNEAALLKRVVALPGETLQIRRGEVYINGERLEEPYAFGKISPAFTELGEGDSNKYTLEPDEYWLMGDNRRLSENYFKMRHQIIGKVL